MNQLRFGQYILRAPEPEDLDCMMQFENTPTMWEVGCASGPYSRFHLKQYIETNRNDLYTDRQLRLMIESDKGEVVGIADLFGFEPFHNRAEVGIVISEPYRGLGIARSALQCLINHASNHLGIHQLVAYIEADNMPSRKLFSSCGFQEIVCLKDWIRHGTSYKDVILMQFLAPSSR